MRGGGAGRLLEGKSARAARTSWRAGVIRRVPAASRGARSPAARPVIDVPVRSDERPVPTGGWVLPPIKPFAPKYPPQEG